MKKRIFLFVIVFIFAYGVPVSAMHIAEGFLPPIWCVNYFALSIPFFLHGSKNIRKRALKDKDIKMLLALIGAYCFMLSAMKLPSVTGSSSHPTGTGLGAIIFGPTIMTVMSTIVLLFQGIFLAHGGITTLGANVFSMGVVGPFISFGIYRVLRKRNQNAAVLLAAIGGDLATYFTTTIQLALAFPSANGGILASVIKFGSIFSITQIPLAIMEGIFTVIIFKFLDRFSKSEMRKLQGVGE